MEFSTIEYNYRMHGYVHPLGMCHTPWYKTICSWHITMNISSCFVKWSKKKNPIFSSLRKRSSSLFCLYRRLASSSNLAFRSLEGCVSGFGGIMNALAKENSIFSSGSTATLFALILHRLLLYSRLEVLFWSLSWLCAASSSSCHPGLEWHSRKSWELVAIPAMTRWNWNDPQFQNRSLVGLLRWDWPSNLSSV